MGDAVQHALRQLATDTQATIAERLPELGADHGERRAKEICAIVIVITREAVDARRGEA
jgi:hypothetical protein